MLKSFTTKEIILIALVSALSVVFAYAFGVLNIATGIPAFAAINGLISVILAVFLYAHIRKFGTIILYWLIHGFLIIPSAALGPPGFYKPIVLFIIALVVELIILLGKKSKVSIYLAMAVGLALVPVMVYFIASAMGIPNLEKTLEIMHFLSGIAFIFGLVGTWIGLTISKKLAKKLR